MSIPNSVLDLIRQEQSIQAGLFIPHDPAYLEKLAQCAELIMHQEGPDVLGYVFFYCNASDREQSYITLLGTSPSARGRGIGYGMVHQVLFISKLRGFRECRLEVSKVNKEAFNFYRRMGFHVVEDRGDKYLMAIVV